MGEPHDFAAMLIWIAICHLVILRLWLSVVFPAARLLLSCICCCSCCCARQAPDKHHSTGRPRSDGNDAARLRHDPPQSEPAEESVEKEEKVDTPADKDACDACGHILDPGHRFC